MPDWSIMKVVSPDIRDASTGETPYAVLEERFANAAHWVPLASGHPDVL
jgi:hypothetical protein